MLKPNKQKMFEDTLVTDSIFGYKFLRLLKPNSRGQQTIFKLEEKHKNKNLRVIVSAKIRTNNIYSKSTLTMAVFSGKENSVLLWKPMFLGYDYMEINKWCSFKDSVDLPEKIDGKEYTYINVFPVLGDTKIEKFDVDSLFVIIKCKL